MGRFVAFLGGINVGKAHRVAMADLRAEFEQLGFDDVSTHINSGNVVFTAPKASGLEATIEQALVASCGFAVPTWVRPAAKVAKLPAASPYADDGATVLVAFLRKAPGAAATKELSTEVDTIKVVGTEAWWRIEGGQMASQLKPKAFAPLGPMTTRNLTMLRKLATKL